MKSIKKTLIWGLAVILTLMVMIYQRKTGPSYPVEGTEKIFGSTVSYKFLRSHISGKELPVEISVDQNDIKGILYYRTYKSGSDWMKLEMEPVEFSLKTKIPSMPPAGKVEYRLKVIQGDREQLINHGNSIVARFRGDVPAWNLILHILFMIISLVLAFRTGFEVFNKEPQLQRLALMTLGSIFIGGFMLGPLMQKFAFGHFWTGFPFGYDLTDNKTLLAFIFWLVAYFLRKKSKWLVLVAVILMLAVYMIPHSVLGSELDPNTGKMKNVYGTMKPPLEEVLLDNEQYRIRNYIYEI